MKRENRETLTRTFHYAAQMPVRLYYGKTCVLSLPASLETDESPYLQKEALLRLSVGEGQPRVTQYVASRYGERFLYMGLDAGWAVLVGPFLSEAVQSVRIYDLIRALHMPVEMYDTLAKYFQTLIIVEETRHFYLGRLLEMVFAQEGDSAPHFAPHRDNAIGLAVFENTYENRMRMFNHPPFFLEQEMVRHVTCGDLENALRILSEINALSRATLARDPVRSLKNSLIGTSTLLTRAAIDGGAPSDEAFTLSDAFIQTLETMDDLRALEQLETEMVRSFVALVKDRAQKHRSPVIKAAVCYIDDHLADKLALPGIAEAVFVHPSYLSARFRRDMGISLSAYIQRRRIEEAKHFLRHTRSASAEIASFYQFCSESYFIQVFKKHTGMTPVQYRVMP